MIIKKLELRGAIGIQKGLKQEQIEIDFTKFNPGLVAIVGTNGSGKTTIMENMHPYRSIKSKPGSLKEHFYLKDSFRKLTFEYNGDTYISNILIDGLTGASEAYLYKNNRALNDGKLTTYDEQIENLIGTEEMFFSSVFSAQKAKGIAELKQSERRDLFYELLNLNFYEKYFEQAKILLAKNQEEKTKLESKKESFETDIQKKEEYEIERTENNIQLDSLNRYIEELTNGKEKIVEEINEIEKAIVRIETEIEAEKGIEKEILELDVEIAEIEKNRQKTISDIQNRLATEKLKETDETQKRYSQEQNEIQLRILELVNDKIGTKTESEKVAEETEQAINELTNLQMRKSRLERILSRKELITKKIEEMDEIQKALTEKSASIRYIDEEQNENRKLASEMQSSIRKIENIKYELCSARDKLKSQKETLSETKNELTESLKNEIAEIREQGKVTKEVPCDTNTGRTCKFLIDAYTKLENLPKLEEERAEQISNLGERIFAIQREIESLQEHIYATSEGKNQEEEKLKEVNSRIEALQQQRQLLKEDYETTARTLQEYQKDNWHKLYEESKQGETELKVIREKEKGLDEKIKILKDNKEYLANEIKKLDINTSELEDLSEQLIVKIAEKKSSIEIKYIEMANQEIQNIQGVIEAQLKQNVNRKNSLLSRHQRTDLIAERAKNSVCVYTRKSFLAETESDINLTQSKLNLSSAKEISLRQAITILQEKEKFVEDIRKQIEKISGEIKECSLIVRAFDKKGIPVMKLEHSGRQITQITNELLSQFDNKFRVVFDTLKLKSDGKEYKEVFDINIIDEDGVCEIAYKSGGQIVWIETAIQLAISLILREQSKNIRTAFLDEKDGALSLENAFNYVSMLQEAHDRSNVYNTYIITHRTELLPHIQNQIKLIPGSNPIITTGVAI